MTNFKKKIVAALSAGIFSFGLNFSAPTQNYFSATSVASAKTLNEDTKKILDEKYSGMIGEKGSEVPGLGIIAFKDGKEVYSNFSGRRHINPDRPMTRNTKLRIASLSKMFTVFSVLQLVDEGKINLDEDVSKYLGFNLRNPNFPDTPITARMLASHTSTIRDGKIYWLKPQYGIEEFFKPGGKVYENGNHFAKQDKDYFEYCNLNYGILGTIIEKVTGERFDIYQKNHIFKDLDIKADYVVGNLSRKDFKNLGTIYRKKKGEVWDENFEWTAQSDDFKTQPPKDGGIIFNTVPKNYKPGTNATIFSPQGGLRISFEELSHCLQMLMDGGKYKGKQIISPESFKEMTTPQWTYDENLKNGDPYGVMYKYGMGIYMIDGDGKARLCGDEEIDFVGHSGEAYGLISGLYFVPGTKDGLLFAVNGLAVEPDENPKSMGKFGGGYIWEEEMTDPVGKYIFAEK